MTTALFYFAVYRSFNIMYPKPRLSSSPLFSSQHTSLPVSAVLGRSVVSHSLWPRGPWPVKLLCPWDSPSKNAGVGCHALLQGIFLTQGLNPCLTHCCQSLSCLRHQESPLLYTLSHIPVSVSTCMLQRGDSGLFFRLPMFSTSDQTLSTVCLNSCWVLAQHASFPFHSPWMDPLPCFRPSSSLAFCQWSCHISS